MAGKPGLSGHRTEVVGCRLTAAERKRLVTDRKGSLSESAYVRWVLTRAADVNPHAGGASSGPGVAGSVFDEVVDIDFDDE